MATIRRDGRPADELRHLAADARALGGSRPSRWFGLPFSESFATVAWYRVNWAGFLAFGRTWSVLRRVLAPLELLSRLIARSEIDYRASIGPGCPSRPLEESH